METIGAEGVRRVDPAGFEPQPSLRSSGGGVSPFLIFSPRNRIRGKILFPAPFGLLVLRLWIIKLRNKIEAPHYEGVSGRVRGKWTRPDSNQQPTDYESAALPLSYGSFRKICPNIILLSTEISIPVLVCIELDFTVASV